MLDPVLTELISENNPQKIENYVKNYLPDNPQNLERIYRQLQNFSQKLNQIISSKDDPNGIISKLSSKNQKLKQKEFNSSNIVMKRYKSQKQMSIMPQKSKIQNYFQRNKIQNITKRQQTLIRNLKQKGIRSSTQDFALGNQVLALKQGKIIKPLQSNKNVVFKQSSSVMSCLKRFNLNKNFYSNSIQDAQVDAQKYYGREMQNFLDRRGQSLSRIVAKQQFQIQKKTNSARRYSKIESKLFSKASKAETQLPLQTIRKLSCSDSRGRQETYRGHNQYLKGKQSQLNSLMKYCTDTLQQIPDYRPKSLLSKNLKFQKIHQRTDEIIDKMSSLYSQFEYQQLSKNKRQINEFARINNNGKQIQKYTLSYLKYIKSKLKNQMIMTNRNDLIKNQAKFRNLVAETKF